ncbi:hypothetical protein OEZ86_008975 [Tetradesmus obliquus]|nr:hypothetical protein OEZ86_008975 [Tetradesmus obliquus]
MGAQSSKVRQEVLEAYRPYLLATTAQLRIAFRSPELLPVYEKAKHVFASIDADGNGEISWEEFLRSVTTYDGKQYKINTQLYRFMFEVFDSDGSGSIDLDEALLMIHNVHSTSRFCDCCSSNLSPLEDGGYCCSKCYEEMQLGLRVDGSTWDICSKCYKGGSGPGACCKIHATGFIVHIEDLYQALEAPGAVLLSNPMADADAAESAGPDGVVSNSVTNSVTNNSQGFKCLCCGEVHDVVLSYLRPELIDLHMRPVMERNHRTGKLEPRGFVCEFCAVQVCSQHSSSDNMWDKLDCGTELFRPAKQQGRHVSAVTRPCDQTLTCHCCGKQHQDFNLGHKVASYLQPGGQAGHMTHMGNGRWVCEFCCTAVCAECGTIKKERQHCREGLWNSTDYYCSLKLKQPCLFMPAFNGLGL